MFALIMLISRAITTPAFFLFTLLMLNGCEQNPQLITNKNPIEGKSMNINEIAEEYVKLTLNVGKHHASYIDAYYGPKAWQPKGEAIDLVTLQKTANKLLEQIKITSTSEEEQQRQTFLHVQLQAVSFFIQQLLQEPFTFEQESLGLYDAISPAIDIAQLDLVLEKLAKLLPGTLPLTERFTKYQSQFIIPTDKLDTVFQAAIKEARERTKQYIALPEQESFTVEYVNNKVWSGYNWYQGNSFSLIQLNTDFPIYIDRAIDLASHEGYPGHHVFNSQMEQHLVNNKGWVEYSVYPLFSPMSLLAEGSANYGIQVVFNEEDRLKFEQDVLFPLAGLDASQAEKYYQILSLKEQLSYIDNLVAAQYLDGIINKAQATELLMKYSLVSHKKAQQRIGFIEANRAYVINYNLGQDIVHQYIDKLTKDGDNNKRWQVFSELLANPKTASMMR